MPYHVSLDKAKEESLGDKKNWNYFKRYMGPAIMIKFQDVELE